MIVQARRRFPFEHRLALLITGVIVLVLAISLALTYRALTISADTQVSDRLAGAAGQFARSIADAVHVRTVELQSAAASDSLHRLLLATPEERAAALPNARAVIARLRRPSADPLRAIELWNNEGERLAFVGNDLAAGLGSSLGSPHAAAPMEPPRDGPRVLPVPHRGLERIPAADSVIFGRMYPVEDRVYYWHVVPVLRGAERLGYLAMQARSVSNANATDQLRAFTGEDLRMVLRNADGRFWMASPGVPTAPRTVQKRLGQGGIFLGPAGTVIAAEAEVEGTPWVAMLETPESLVHRRMRGILVTIAGIGLLLTIAGALVSWIMGRRIAHPLASLTTAAEAIAQGDYERRVPFSGSDEIGRLAASFNQMAVEVDVARRELQQRFEEARATAQQLERSNAQLQQAKEEAEQAREEAQHANRAKSDFLAVMSHELRTPLNAIGGYAQLIDLEIHGPVTAAQHEALSRIARSQAHLLRLINDVLNFAQVDAGHVRYAIHDMPLDDTLSEIEALVAPQLRAKGLTFSYEPCEDAITVRADRDKFNQVMINLVSNAIKFTPEGGRIDVRCDGDRDLMRVRVRDSGPGIPGERLETIFDPFVQLDRTVHQSAEGVGLGLAISRDLARGMGGDLEADSELGLGATFTLTLARHAAAAPVRPAMARG